jgi:hypothetical protein
MSVAVFQLRQFEPRLSPLGVKQQYNEDKRRRSEKLVLQMSRNKPCIHTYFRDQTEAIFPDPTQSYTVNLGWGPGRFGAMHLAFS